MTSPDFGNSGYFERIAREEARALLETKVLQRHGHIERIQNMSDDALRILLEEKPRR